MRSAGLAVRLALLGGLVAAAGCVHHTTETRGMSKKDLAIINVRGLRKGMAGVSIDGQYARYGCYYVLPGSHMVSYGSFARRGDGAVDAKAGVRYTAYLDSHGFGSMATYYITFAGSDGSRSGGPPVMIIDDRRMKPAGDEEVPVMPRL